MVGAAPRRPTGRSAQRSATAQGFGSALTGGKALKSTALRQLFGLQAHEHAPCFISIGTAHTRKPTKPRPSPEKLLSSLGGAV